MTASQPGNISLGHTEILFREDGIVQANATDREYSKEDIQEIEKCIWEVSGNKKVCVLLIGSNYTSIDPEARKFLATPESGMNFTAKAYVVRSLAQRLVVNFLIKVEQPQTPSRFFNDMGSAVEWLKTL